MTPISPARFLPGVTHELPSSGHTGDDSDAATADRVVTGTALIFWDPDGSGRKLDAIDTDQITPAADCVSESLETLDERWKAGSFRHLMPDFRERVHRGENFIVAGERFAGRARSVTDRTRKAPIVEDAIVVVIGVARATLPVSVVVVLVRIGSGWAVVADVSPAIEVDVSLV